MMPDLLKEWKEFESDLNLRVDPDFEKSLLLRKVLHRIQQDLAPDPQVTARKFALIQAAVLGVILFFCPQLGPGVSHSHGVFWVPDFLHHRPLLCAVYCGTLSFTLSQTFSLFFLRSSERRCLNQMVHQVPWVLGLGLFYLMIALGTSWVQGRINPMLGFLWSSVGVLGFVILLSLTTPAARGKI